MSRMYQRFERGEVAVGPFIPVAGPEWLEVCGYVGLDFAVIDFMVTAIDWHQAADMIRGASRYDLSVWIRLQAYPWGGDQFDPRLPADVVRALAIGADCVMASCNTVEQVESMVMASKDWHRRFWVQRGIKDRNPTEAHYDKLEKAPLVFPLIESKRAFDRLDEILSIKDLQAIFLGLGDLSKELGLPFDDRHPKLREAVLLAIEKAKKHDVKVFTNVFTYGPGKDTPDYVADGIKWLWEHGVPAVWIPSQIYAAQRYHHHALRLLDEQLPLAHPSLYPA